MQSDFNEMSVNSEANNNNIINNNESNEIMLIFRFSGRPIQLTKSKNSSETFYEVLQQFMKKLQAQFKECTRVDWGDLELVYEGRKIDLQESVQKLDLKDNANIYVQFKKEKSISLSLSFEPGGVKNNNINIEKPNKIEKTNKILPCNKGFLENQKSDPENFSLFKSSDKNNKENSNVIDLGNNSEQSIKIEQLNGLSRLESIINTLAAKCNSNEEIFLEQINKGNLFIGNKPVKTEDCGNTFLGFLNVDLGDISGNLNINAVMKNVSLVDIKVKKFCLTKANKVEEINAINESFKGVNCRLADKLITVIKRWCEENELQSDKFIEFIKSNKIKLKLAEVSIEEKYLESRIKDIATINSQQNDLNLTFESDENFSLDEIKIKGFDIFFKVIDTKKEVSINGFNENQTLEEIIGKIIEEIIKNVNKNIGSKRRYDNIIAQIKGSKLKIVANEKEYVFKESDLEKPFYKIVGDINEFKVADGDNNKPIIRFQIESLEIAKNEINENGVQDNSRLGVESQNDGAILQEMIKWFIKVLMLLAVVFAVLSIFAFALKFALALKIIFLVIDAMCFIGLGRVHIKSESKIKAREIVEIKIESSLS